MPKGYIPMPGMRHHAQPPQRQHTTPSPPVGAGHSRSPASMSITYWIIAHDENPELALINRRTWLRDEPRVRVCVAHGSPAASPAGGSAPKASSRQLSRRQRLPMQLPLGRSRQAGGWRRRWSGFRAHSRSLLVTNSGERADAVVTSRGPSRRQRAARSAVAMQPQAQSEVPNLERIFQPRHPGPTQ